MNKINTWIKYLDESVKVRVDCIWSVDKRMVVDNYVRKPIEYKYSYWGMNNCKN